MTSQPNEALVEMAWAALKKRCCADPENASRIVMMSRDDLSAIIPVVQAACEAEVVAWLREYDPDTVSFEAYEVADALERGEHRSKDNA